MPKELTSTEQDPTIPVLSISQLFTVQIPLREEINEPIGDDYDIVCYTFIRMAET